MSEPPLTDRELRALRNRLAGLREEEDERASVLRDRERRRKGEDIPLRAGQPVTPEDFPQFLRDRSRLFEDLVRTEDREDSPEEPTHG